MYVQICMLDAGRSNLDTASQEQKFVEDFQLWKESEDSRISSCICTVLGAHFQALGILFEI